MSADVFGSGVHYHIHPAIERALQHRGGEGAVTDADSIGLAPDSGHSPQVRNLHEGVGGCLDNDQASAWAHDGAHCVGIGHVDIGGFERPLAEDAAYYLSNAVINIGGRDNVVAGLETLHQRGYDRQA